MRVLITGGAGFIGSHLCDRLVSAGHRTVAVDDLSLGRAANLAHLAARENFAFQEMSVLDEAFESLMQAERFDVVFHLAANSDIQAGSVSRRVDLERTFLTTWSVCENMARCGVGQLILASTSAVYGETDRPAAEDHGPLTPISFYGAAKLASEAYASAYAHRHAIRTWVFRFPNVVGPRATHGVIFDFVRKLRSNGNRLDVLGDGTQEKPYLYVDDLLEAILLAWERRTPEPYEVFNVGPGSATRVRTIAEGVVAAMGLEGSAAIRYGTEARGWPGDVPKFAYNLDKIHSLGWKERRSSDDAVRQAIRDVVSEVPGP